MGIQIATSEEGREKHKITVTETRNNSTVTVNTTAENGLHEPARGRFYFPVDRKALFRTDAIAVPDRDLILRKQDTGEFLHNGRELGKTTLPHRRYNIELTSTAMKVYLAVTAEIEVSPGEDTISLQFPEPTDVQIGARSFHRKPGHVISTSRDSGDIMKALSYLGAENDDESPDRTYPTLRRHPPLLEWDDAFDAPHDLDRPATGITIEVPAEMELLYPVAPLAYYLGATLRPSDPPRLVTDDGFEYALTGDQGFQKTVHRVLKQVFTLDCVTRTGRLYDVDLHERNRLESRLALDFDRLYETSLRDRVAAYLAVPYDHIADLVPDWHLTIDMEPDVEHLPAIPFAANQLPTIRTMETRSRGARDSTSDTTVEMAQRSPLSSFEASHIVPSPTDTVEHGWIGEQYPMNANKLTTDPLHFSALNPLNETATTKYVVVSNRMDGSRPEDFIIPSNWNAVDVEFHTDVTVDQLRDVFSGAADLVQFIGPVSEDGLECEWGALDIGTLPSTDVTAFMLNGCRSFDQAEKLVEKGSYVGVATVGSVGNEEATLFGKTVGKLLMTGFPVRTAVALAREVIEFQPSHLTLGNGGVTSTSSERAVALRSFG